MRLNKIRFDQFFLTLQCLTIKLSMTFAIDLSIPLVTEASLPFPVTRQRTTCVESTFCLLRASLASFRLCGKCEKVLSISFFGEDKDRGWCLNFERSRCGLHFLFLSSVTPVAPPQARPRRLEHPKRQRHSNILDSLAPDRSQRLEERRPATDDGPPFRLNCAPRTTLCLPLARPPSARCPHKSTCC